MPQDLPVVLHNEKRGLLTIEESRLDVLQLSRDGRPPKRLLSCSVRNLLLVKLAGSTGHTGQRRRLDLHTLIQKGSSSLRLSKMHVLVEPINIPEADEWVQEAMASAYRGVKPYRRVLVLVNPVGGKGKGRAIVKESVVPLLEAAGCRVEVRETTHRNHAEEIVRDMDLSAYDVVAPASGDGLIHEIFNGLASRPDARKALKMPIGPIPTGSANALCINLFGTKDTFNIELACLNIIKGRHMPKDLCSVYLLESKKRIWSFLALAGGLMVDLDIGTENIRWMGDIRFTLGFIKGVATSHNHKCRIRMKVLAEDKVEMARAAREWAKGIVGQKVIGGGMDPLVNGIKKSQVEPSVGTNGHGITDGHVETADGDADGSRKEAHGFGDALQTGDDESLPQPTALEVDGTWTTIETGTRSSPTQSERDAKAAATGQSAGWINGEGILYSYAGNMPWIARDLMQWPVSVQGSGAFDVVVQSIVPRSAMLAAITGAAKGEQYWMECQHYYKVDAMVIENLDKENQKIFTIDGEAIPYEDHHVELFSGLGTVLSLDGHFFIPEFMTRHDRKG